MLTLEMAEPCTCDGDSTRVQTLPPSGDPGALAGWGGGAWMRMELLFPVRKVFWNRESELGCRDLSRGCGTPHKVLFAPEPLRLVVCNGGGRVAHLRGGCEGSTTS